MSFDTLKSVEAYLDEMPKFQSEGAAAADFDLTRFEQFCTELGNPHDNFPSVHVAGTNGKGSTCRILESVFLQAGYKTGIYTSPHLHRFSKRFQINGQDIPEEDLTAFFNKYADKLEEYGLTHFEVSTAVAFWWFDLSDVDLAIIEVGLGGRLDATNIIDPLVSVITSISLDHTAILGDTISEIAREKGGIIKADRPVVVGDLPDNAYRKILAIADEKRSPVYTIDELNPRYKQEAGYQLTVDGEVLSLNAKFRAPVQAKNIAMAWQVTQQIAVEFPVTAAQFKEGVQKASVGYGRFERLTESQLWYFDGAHNIEAVREMKQSMQLIGNFEEAILVLSMMKDKVRPPVMRAFSEFPNIYYHQLNLERAASFNDIKQWLPQAKSFPNHRVQHFFANELNSELVIFAGSFYLYELVRDWVEA